MKPYCVILLGILLFALLPALNIQAQPAAQGIPAIVLAFPGDAYFSLAEEIAQAESLPLAQNWADALAKDPAVILWVVAPIRLSDRVIVEAGLALKKHNSLPAVGIISGATQAEARQLWQRGQALRARSEQGTAPVATHFFAANGESPAAGIPQARLIAFSGDQTNTSALDVPALAGALQQADYLTFTGHGGGTYIRLDDETKFIASDIPNLPPLVISTASCQTFRLWNQNSIALGFIHQGAAAYAGFVYSPLEGYLIGEFQDLPFHYAWPEFPIGQIMALQNRGTLQGFAYFPHYFLLGDPRIALQFAPPYQLVKDEVAGEVRTLTYRGAPQGLIPVRVPEGGRYRYVEIRGLAATADGDAFFNDRLQAASLHGDKLIIFTHSGGDFTLQLHETPPWHWGLTYPLLAAFDDVTLFMPQNGGDAIMVVAGLFFLGLALLRGWLRRKQPGLCFRRIAGMALIAGISITLLLGLYQLLRLPHAVITAKPLALSPLWLVGVFLLTVSGSGLFWLVRAWPGKLLALAVVVIPALLPGLFGLAAVGYINLIANQQAGSAIYNTHLASLPLIASGVWLVVLGAGLWGLGTWIKPSQAIN